ncbi:YEATS domain-containing protein 4 [Pancytospora philotis]|nr:YEATS domain-containing protein 4 [Pancytospora philotis]
MNGYATVPVIIGSESRIIPMEEREIPELSHSWTCYVRAQPSLVKSVQFKLHESFPNPIRTVSEAPFELTERGWGEFSVQVKIVLFNDERVQTSHFLKLHADSYPFVMERHDTIVYRGSQEAIAPEYDYKDPDEDEEYHRIDGAIHAVLDMYEESKAAADDGSEFYKAN